MPNESLVQNYSENRKVLLDLLRRRGEFEHYDEISPYVFGQPSQKTSHLFLQSEDPEFKNTIRKKFRTEKVSPFQQRLFSHMIYEYPGNPSTTYYHLMDRDGNVLFDYKDWVTYFEDKNPELVEDQKIRFARHALSNAPNDMSARHNFIYEGKSYTPSAYDQLIHCAFCCELGKEQSQKQNMPVAIKKKATAFYTQLQECNLQTAAALYDLAEDLNSEISLPVDQKSDRYLRFRPAA